ncbi:MAG: D-tyrosyl-tRNA(Tyr) deacylase [Candidatus Dormibacteraeota bacterium]|nr:D-tyrosyl-tRNA(Tyr) deacylase [Candidatus Dormibacteraeota bacterium]
MRAVVQRVSRAAVRVDGETVGSIDKGLCVLLSVAPSDDESVAHRFAGRIASLRIFPDGAGKMNLDCAAAGGAMLVISQFTLYADTSRGHRPSFIRAAPPEQAERLYRAFVSAATDAGLSVATGRFGAHMDVELCNDGPVTIVASSAEPPWEADAG